MSAADGLPPGRGGGAPREDAVPLPRTLGDLLVGAGRLGWHFVGVVLALYLIGVIAARLMLVVMPVLVALLLTTLLLPPAVLLERAGLRRGLASLLVVVGGVAVLGGIFGGLVPSFAAELGNLGARAREGAEQVLDWLATSTPLPVDGMGFDDLLQRISEQAGAGSGDATEGVLAGVAAALEAVTGLLLTLVLCFFFIKDRDKLTRWLVSRSPQRQRGDVAAVGSRAWSTLAGYLRGTAMIAVVDAVGIAVGLLLLGVPLVLPLSLLVFFGAFFPIVGAFVAGLAATLVALVTGGVVQALLALGVVVAVQQIEGNLLQPVVMSRAVPLHPIVVLLSLTAGGALGGVAGAFVAVPVAAVVAASFNELRERHPAALGAVVPSDGGATKLKADPPAAGGAAGG